MASKIDYFEKCYRIIGRCINEGNTRFVIYPFGNRGKLVKGILNNSYGCKEYLIFDNVPKTRNHYQVYEIDRAGEYDMEGAILLLASDNPKVYSEVRSKALEFFKLEEIIDLFSPSCYFDPDVFYDYSYFSSESPNYQRYSLCESCMKEIYYYNIAGSIAECGVLRGDFANVMSRCFPDRKLFLFDTFEGIFEDKLPPTEKDMWDEKVLESSSAHFRDVPSMQDIIDSIAWKNQLVVKKGLFPETAIGDKEVEEETFCLVDIDMGYYDPTHAALYFFYERLAPGGYLFVDDIRHEGVMSVRRAVEEFCADYSIGYSTIQYHCNGLAIITKPIVPKNRKENMSKERKHDSADN